MGVLKKNISENIWIVSKMILSLIYQIKAGGNRVNTAKLTMTTLLQKQQTLSSMVESMKIFSQDSSNRGKAIFEDFKKRCGQLIEELRAKGVTEATHPVFKNAVTAYNYWK